MKGTERKVLIVDAEKPFVAAIREGFMKAGFHVFVTETRKEALEIARKEHPSIVLISVELPAGVAEGYLVCKDLKMDAELKKIPVIILSRRAKEEDFERHRQLKTRADAYMKKPVTDEELFAKVENLLGFQITGADYSVLEAKLHAFLEEKQALEETIRDRERQILELEQKLNEALKGSAKGTKHEERIQELEGRLLALETRYATEKKKWEETLEELRLSYERKILELKSQNTHEGNWQKQKPELESEKERLQREIKVLNEHLERSRKDAERIPELEGEIVELRSQLEEYRERTRTLREFLKEILEKSTQLYEQAENLLKNLPED